MRKQLVSEVHGRRANIAWLSLQPDGSISFGLNDRAFYSPRASGNFGIFNAYNRVRAEFTVASDSANLNAVQNPHFTFHPIATFHLTGNGDQDIFKGLLDTSIVLQQQPILPWLRVTTRSIATLDEAGVRADGVHVEPWVIPLEQEDVSVRVAVDLLRPAPITTAGPWQTCHLVEWHGILVRVMTTTTPAQIATLAWYYEH